MSLAVSPKSRFRRAASSLTPGEQSVLSADTSPGSQAFIGYALRSEPIRVFFETQGDDACVSAVRLFAMPLRAPHTSPFIRTANPTKMRVVVGLFPVPLEAEPICGSVFSTRLSDRKEAVKFVETGVQVLEKDFRPNPPSREDISTA